MFSSRSAGLEATALRQAGCLTPRFPLTLAAGTCIESPRKGNSMSDKPAGAEKKIAAGICGILLGCLGIHKFILGYTKEALIMLLVSVLSCGTLSPIMGIIGLIEGIIYLTKSD